MSCSFEHCGRQSSSCTIRILCLQGDYDNPAREGSGYDESSYGNQQTGYDSQSGQQQGYEDVTGQQNGYTNTTPTDYTVDTPHADKGYADSTNTEGNNSSISQGSARQGLQAQGEGFGQGFNQGFGQGLRDDPDGSQPHNVVHIQEDVGPGHESRETDVVSDEQTAHIACSCPP